MSLTTWTVTLRANGTGSLGFDVDDATSRRRQHNFGAPRRLEKTRAGRGNAPREYGRSNEGVNLYKPKSEIGTERARKVAKQRQLVEHSHARQHELDLRKLQQDGQRKTEAQMMRGAAPKPRRHGANEPGSRAGPRRRRARGHDPCPTFARTSRGVRTEARQFQAPRKRDHAELVRPVGTRRVDAREGRGDQGDENGRHERRHLSPGGRRQTG